MSDFTRIIVIHFVYILELDLVSRLEPAKFGLGFLKPLSRLFPIPCHFRVLESIFRVLSLNQSCKSSIFFRVNLSHFVSNFGLFRVKFRLSFGSQ